MALSTNREELEKAEGGRRAELEVEIKLLEEWEGKLRKVLEG